MNKTIPEYDIILVESFSSINFLTLPVHGYIIWLMLSSFKRTMESDFFSLNLALSEVLFSSHLPFLLVSLHFGGQFMPPYHFPIGFLLTARPLFQTCICLDYYLGVVHPMVFLKCKPLRYRAAVCGAAWLVILASCVLFFTIFEYHYLFFIQTVLFMGLVIGVCVRVLMTLKKPGPGDNTGNKSNKMKRRAFKMIFLILISMTFNLIFTVAPIPLQSFLPYLEYLAVMTSCFALSLASGIMQPLLYMHRTGRLTCSRRPRLQTITIKHATLREKNGGVHRSVHR